MRGGAIGRQDTSVHGCESMLARRRWAGDGGASHTKWRTRVLHPVPPTAPVEGCCTIRQPQCWPAKVDVACRRATPAAGGCAGYPILFQWRGHEFVR